MSLLKCPDCGKMVSKRAVSCPNCGCPSEFFLAESNQEETNDINNVSHEVELGERSDDRIGQREEVLEKKDEELLDEFVIIGKKFSYPRSAELYIESIKYHNEMAAKTEVALKKKYDETNNADDLLKSVIPSAIRIIDKVVNENLEILYHSGINIDEEDFKEKYGINLEAFITGLCAEYNNIVKDAQNVQRAREYERASRSRWEGGGFGISGAIKGAVKAGALNAVTGVGRAISDSIVDSSDNANTNRAKTELSNNEEYENYFLFGFRVCIMRADEGMAEEFAVRSRTMRLSISYKDAFQEYCAAMKYENDNVELLFKMLDIIEIHPLLKPAYEMILQASILLNDEEVDELFRFMAFWGMQGDFQSVFSENEARKKVKGYLERNPELKKIDFEDYSPETYVKARTAKRDLIQLLGKQNFPKSSSFCIQLNNFYANCMRNEACLDSILVLPEISENTSIYDLTQKIHEQKEVIPGLLTGIWVRGDKDGIPEVKLKTKWCLPENDVIFFYQNNAIFGTAFGGDGFVLTNSVICDLKSKSILPLAQIENIIYKGDKILVLNNHCKIVINLGSEKLASRKFFFDCLELFIKYCTCSNEEKHVYIVKAYVEQMQRIISKYAQKCGIEDTNELLYKFLIKHGVEICVQESTFCPYCGNKIYKGSKFCNFCGKANTYGK